VHNLFGWKFWAFIVGAAPLEPELEEFWSKLGFLVVQGYGLTETAPIVTLNHPFHTSKGSVGKAIGGVEIRIAPDGEILVRGANVTSGYFTANADGNTIGGAIGFDSGWFHTGDIGSVDAEGRVFVQGRKKELIISPDGLNIFPEDVERVLNRIPGVRDSAVVGPDRVHAVLLLDEGILPERIVEQANASLESHQQIREFSLWTEGPLPRTEGTQKLKRMAIRDWVLGERAASDLAAKPDANDGELLAGYSDDTPLAQLGLNSLDRVELMMRAEKSGATGISDSAFERSKTVGELRRIARSAAAAAPEPVDFPRWNRSALAQALRRVMLPGFLLPLLRLFVVQKPRNVHNLHNLHNVKGPVLFAVNHQSIFDVPAVLAALPDQWRYRTASAMGQEWFRPRLHPAQFSLWERFGNNLQYYLVCLFFNAFPIAQHDAGARDTLRYMGELASDNWSVLLFPEGVRTTGGEINPFRPGVGMIASRLRIPVVPVRIEGLDRVLHQSWHWPKRGWVSVSFGAPLYLAGDDYAGLAANVEAAVRDLDKFCN
jgi:long-chain acyl-CoA synthetase